MACAKCCLVEAPESVSMVASGSQKALVEPDDARKYFPDSILEEGNEIQPGEIEYEVTLMRTPEEFHVGLDVDWGDLRKLRVAGVKQGLVSKWNANPDNWDRQILDDDVLVKINGVQGDAMRLLEQIRRAPVLTIKVRSKRQNQEDTGRFKVKIVKEPGAAIGLDVNWLSGKELKVVGVTAGMVQQWNEAPENRRRLVEPGDFVTDINDVTGDALKMLGVIQTASVLTMTVEKKRYREEPLAALPPPMPLMPQQPPVQTMQSPGLQPSMQPTPPMSSQPLLPQTLSGPIPTNSQASINNQQQQMLMQQQQQQLQQLQQMQETLRQQSLMLEQQLKSQQLGNRSP